VTKFLTINYTMKWYGVEEQTTWLYEELLYKINSLYYSLPGYKNWRIKSDKNWTIVLLYPPCYKNWTINGDKIFNY
jgi:hypothetical protein